jgi:hypothetical protein
MSGYIYCFTNPSMPGLVKCGETERTPIERLRDANVSNTWIPTPFKIEFAKFVKNPKEKETNLHKILEKYIERVNTKREFFRISVEDVKIFFDLIDGEWWNQNESIIESDNDTEIIQKDWRNLIINNENVILTKSQKGLPTQEEINGFRYKIIFENNSFSHFLDPSTDTKYKYPTSLCKDKLQRQGNTNEWRGTKHCLVFRENNWISLLALE